MPTLMYYFRTVLSAVDAFDNQKVLQLVREAGSTSRCLGVITKCDMVQDRDELIVGCLIHAPTTFSNVLLRGT